VCGGRPPAQPPHFPILPVACSLSIRISSPYDKQKNRVGGNWCLWLAGSHDFCLAMPRTHPKCRNCDYLLRLLGPLPRDVWSDVTDVDLSAGIGPYHNPTTSNRCLPWWRRVFIRVGCVDEWKTDPTGWTVTAIYSSRARHYEGTGDHFIVPFVSPPEFATWKIDPPGGPEYPMVSPSIIQCTGGCGRRDFPMIARGNPTQ